MHVLCAVEQNGFDHCVTVFTTEPAMRKKSAAFLLLFTGASMLVGFLWNLLFGQIVSLHPEQIGDWLNGPGPWAPLVFVAAMACAVVISPIPSVPLDIAAGLAFGWFWGTVHTLIGAEIGAIVAFLIARRLGRPWLMGRLPQSTMAKIDELAERQGVRALLVMRLMPVFNFDWVSYAAGLTAVSLPVFTVATFVGMIPAVIAIVAVGATLTDNLVFSGALVAGMVMLALGPLLLPWLPVTHKKERKPNEH